jgi:hypothetical protein
MAAEISASQKKGVVCEKCGSVAPYPLRLQARASPDTLIIWLMSAWAPMSGGGDDEAKGSGGESLDS